MSSQQPPYSSDWTPTSTPHPQATPAMALGLIGLIGILTCVGVTLVISPFAWAIGSKTVREIDANPGSYSGREMAVAGKVMGIIGTVLLVLALVVVALFVAWVFSLDDASFDS
jgi:hypothetical protein